MSSSAEDILIETFVAGLYKKDIGEPLTAAEMDIMREWVQARMQEPELRASVEAIHVTEQEMRGSLRMLGKTYRELKDHLTSLERGEISINQFKAWFKSLRWDSVKGFNTPGMAPLGWAIETALFDNDVTADDLRETIHDTLQRYD